MIIYRRKVNFFFNDNTLYSINIRTQQIKLIGKKLFLFENP